MHEQRDSKTKYQVKVGHAEVSVQCANEDEAVRLARKLLSNDMPRLYDVINRLDVDRFQVRPIP